MNLEELIEEYEIPVVQIDDKRKYWLVRTQSGEYYEQFYFENFISVGWDEFNDIEKFKTADKSVIIKEIEKAYPENKKPGLIYSQIKRFLFELSPGDVVMIPSPNSTRISFGIILSDVEIKNISETDIEEGECPFTKRRNVKWLKTIRRAELDPYLYKMMHTHLTISNATEYAEVIDRTLHSFYIKKGTAHLVLEVKQENDIPAMDLINGINNILDIVPLLKNPQDENVDFNKSDIDLKLRVQSPGVIEFISNDVPWAIFGIGIVLTFVVGGTIKGSFTKEKTEVEASSQGLIEKILKLRKQKDSHKLKELDLIRTIESLKLQLPEETKNLPKKDSKED
ncbi:restriction endonuclease [Bacillus subtilis]|uniref:restriction endonuclease n=2 Tax=Bacillaceae TaxID=186817 RepID=UPI001377E02D|nr:hypothetical protein [Bacillus subtilis]KAF1341723.1 hypothetical protein ABP1_2423 [Bacillus subtilis]